MNQSVKQVFQGDGLIIERCESNEVVLICESSEDADILENWLLSLRSYPESRAKARIIRSNSFFLIGQVGDVISRHENFDIIRVFGVDYSIPIQNLMYME